jgi:hypothetical protein
MSELVLTKLFGIEGGYTVTHTEQAETFLHLHLEISGLLTQWRIGGPAAARCA